MPLAALGKVRREKDASKVGSYRVQMRNDAGGQWYEISDLHVQETLPQLIGLSESYMMVYTRQERSDRATAGKE